MVCEGGGSCLHELKPCVDRVHVCPPQVRHQLSLYLRDLKRAVFKSVSSTCPSIVRGFLSLVSSALAAAARLQMLLLWSGTCSVQWKVLTQGAKKGVTAAGYSWTTTAVFPCVRVGSKSDGRRKTPR